MELTYKEFAEKNPELCQPKIWIEDSNFLEQFGIKILNKQSFPLGFVKYLPQDFIVEEIGIDGKVCTIEHEDGAVTDHQEGLTVYATLVKCNITTFEAIRLMAQELGCKESQIQYAGIKDQRAITAQRVSFRGVTIDAVRSMSFQNLFLKDISAGKGVLQPGALWGNRFTIFVRTEPALFNSKTKNILITQFENVVQNGFNNFFYLQRFGAPRYINYLWGKDILQGNYADVIRSVLLETSVTEVDFFATLRQKLRVVYGDWSAMLEYIDQNVPTDVFQHERSIIEYLQKNPTDFRGALRFIDKQSQLWVYAFSSLLFNQHLSSLIEKQQVPERLPLVLSNKREDTEPYRLLLKEMNAWPPRWSGARDFGFIQLRSRSLHTTSSVEVESVNVVPEGIHLQFRLQKGEYATTFLSHLFNLLGGPLEAHDAHMSFADEAVVPDSIRTRFQTVLAEEIKKDSPH